MPDIQHYCHACNILLGVKRSQDGTETTVMCPRCNFTREYTRKTPAERQAGVRQRKGENDPTIKVRTTHRPEGGIHARTTRCPGCLSLLTKKNLSPSTAIKGCIPCQRKFTYTRTDTPEGRKLRVQQWRERKNAMERDSSPGHDTGVVRDADSIQE